MKKVGAWVSFFKVILAVAPLALVVTLLSIYPALLAVDCAGRQYPVITCSIRRIVQAVKRAPKINTSCIVSMLA